MDGRAGRGGPGFVPPMLAVPGVLPVDPTGWAAEVKWDGIRLITAVAGDGTVRCWTRAAREVTASWPQLRTAPPAAAGRTLLLDAEIVALDGAGRPSFGLLQQRGRPDPARGGRAPAVTLMVFDLLAAGGTDLCPQPWHDRRRRLEDLGLAAGQRVWQVPAASADPAALHAFTAARGLEGIVCKRVESPYRPGARSPEWRKVKHVRTQEVVLGGWLPGRGSRTGELGALLLGIPDPAGGGTADGLHFVGRVGTGFDASARADLLVRLAPLARPTPPFVGAPSDGVAPPGWGRDLGLSPAERVDARWTEPVLVGEVAFAEWTGHGRLRQPAWRGLRPDKTPAEVVVE